MRAADRAGAIRCVSDLDFFADLVTTGPVLALDHIGGADEVFALFGERLAPERASTSTTLVDFARSRGPRGWEVDWCEAQAHRLGYLAGQVGDPLVARGCYEVSEARLRDRLVELAGRVDPEAEWAGLSSALHSTNAGKLTERRARVTRVAAEALCDRRLDEADTRAAPPAAQRAARPAPPDAAAAVPGRRGHPATVAGAAAPAAGRAVAGGTAAG